MKVLFAVNSESVSDAIIKRYQREYKEILSYKNVYYFNAILKEIQKDKTYDRIVISEDLEPFSNNNYDTIDKFIFEKLDNISDEAQDSEGNETSIILICNERHTKGSSFLVKLFGIGVYNALLGTDRKMEEVCKLINKPRVKKEAKLYYQIDSDEVSYDPKSEKEVSELEIQNILTHFKKIAKNREKYADSFNNIASQYTDEQLKIIINCLPISVKAVLEEESPRYQELMSANGLKMQKVGKIVEQEVKPKSGIKIDILENKMNQTKMSGPIVIPSSVKTAKNRGPVLSKPIESSTQQSEKIVKPMSNTENKKVVKKVSPKPVTDEDEDNLLLGLDQIDDIENVNDLPKEEAKNEKNLTPSMFFDSDEETDNSLLLDFDDEKTDEFVTDNDLDEDEIAPVLDNEDDDLDSLLPSFEENEEEKIAAKKGRGRPRKNPVQEEEKSKGKRGRPRKNENYEEVETEYEEDDDSLLLNFDDEETENEETDDSLVLDFDDEEKDELVSNSDLDDEEYTDEVSLPGIDELDDIEDYEEDSMLPGVDYEEVDDDDYLLPGFENQQQEVNDDNDSLLLDFEDDLDNDSEDDLLTQSNVVSNNRNTVNNSNNYSNAQTNQIESIKPQVDYSMSSLNSLLTKDKKIVTFIGTTKNGTSFLVNNLASLFSSIGINVAILDMTKNRNSYYIYTKNEEELRKIAYTSIEKLQDGYSEGIKVDKNLTVYTALPNDGKDYSNTESILSTLVQNHSLILIDCDFDTDPSYFASCQEIYLVQSMDILTIQPLTSFLRDLKAQGVLEPEKVRVVINKEIKVRSLTSKVIIGGMSFYNDPAMSFMTELFNKDMVKACSIPFEENAYSKYLDAMVNCNVSISAYSKNFSDKLRVLGNMVYPLTSKQTYSKPEKGYTKNAFSNSINNTLNQMKNKY